MRIVLASLVLSLIVGSARAADVCVLMDDAGDKPVAEPVRHGAY